MGPLSWPTVLPRLWRNTRGTAGWFPEVAARAHLEAMPQVLSDALSKAGVTYGDLDAIAVTSGPGLAGALMVGVGAAKALSVSLGLPLYAVNHLVGHVGVECLSESGDTLETPTIALLVSGGHTSLLLVRDLVHDVELLGETIDDAAGEAFDKVARVLGLAYPGGPEIDRVARRVTLNSSSSPVASPLTKIKTNIGSTFLSQASRPRWRVMSSRRGREVKSSTLRPLPRLSRKQWPMFSSRNLSWPVRSTTHLACFWVGE